MTSSTPAPGRDPLRERRRRRGIRGDGGGCGRCADRAERRRRAHRTGGGARSGARPSACGATAGNCCAARRVRSKCPPEPTWGRSSACVAASACADLHLPLSDRRTAPRGAREVQSRLVRQRPGEGLARRHTLGVALAPGLAYDHSIAKITGFAKLLLWCAHADPGRWAATRRFCFECRV